MAERCPLTVAAARAILIADDALALSFAAREAIGQTFGIEELDAWRTLVTSAKTRIAEYYPGESAPDLYPGGNEPDFQTLFVEALARSDQRRTTR